MQKEYSKILRHDFPVIPILGSVLLALILLNSSTLIEIYYSPINGLNVQTILITVSMLGSGGVVLAHLIAFSSFDGIFLLRKKFFKVRKASDSSGEQGKASSFTSYDWFAVIQAASIPMERATGRSGEHSISNRRKFDKISPSQIRATLHALEYHFRSFHSGMATQLEYYYSAGIMFVTLAIASGLLFVGSVLSKATTISVGHWLGADASILVTAADLGLALFSLSAATKAGRLKEYLRIVLFDSHRVQVLQLIEQWFDVRFEISGVSDPLNKRQAGHDGLHSRDQGNKGTEEIKSGEKVSGTIF